MPEFRRYPMGSSRQLIDFNRFLELTGTKVLVCLDKGVIQVCRYLLMSRGQWRTTYYTSVEEYGYFMPDQADFDILINAINEGVDDMSSCEDIVTALQGIQTAIEGSGTAQSSGCGCVGSGDDDITDINDIPSVELPSEGDPPDTFATWEEYNEYKCNSAHWFIDNWIGTLRNWGGLAGVLGGLTLAVITGLLLLTVPPVGLMVILGALSTLVSVDFALLSFLNDTADIIENNRDDIACDIYTSSNSNQAISRVASRVGSLIQGESWTQFIKDSMSTIALNLLTNEGLEVVFSNNGTLPEGYVGDCSTCDSPFPRIWEWPGTDKQSWTYTDIQDTDGRINQVTSTGNTRTRIVHPGTAQSTIGRWRLQLAEADWIEANVGITVRWVGRMNVSPCANGLTFGVIYSDDSTETHNVSPYTYFHATDNETIEFQLANGSPSGGGIKEIYWQFEQGTNCLSSGSYDMICDSMSLWDI